MTSLSFKKTFQRSPALLPSTGASVPESEGAAAPMPRASVLFCAPATCSRCGPHLPSRLSLPLRRGRGRGRGLGGKLPVGAAGVGTEPGVGAVGLRGPVVLGVAVLGLASGGQGEVRRTGHDRRAQPQKEPSSHVLGP